MKASRTLDMVLKAAENAKSGPSLKMSSATPGSVMFTAGGTIGLINCASVDVAAAACSRLLYALLWHGHLPDGSWYTHTASWYNAQGLEIRASLVEFPFTK